LNYLAKSIRPFLGSQDFEESSNFYKDLGFTEHKIDDKMSWFGVNESMSFYLQAYYVKEWIENTMVFLEVGDVDTCYKQLLAKQLPNKYPKVKLTEMKNEP